MTMIAPDAWLGLLGGGQLGRMFVHAAQALGYRVLVLDPDKQSPAGATADRHLCAPYEDAAALAEMARTCAAATTEFENVPAGALETLARSMPVRPDAAAVRIAQDRSREKAFFTSHGFAVAPYKLLESIADCADVPSHLLPGIVKTARLGYDGKGQIQVSAPGEVAAAFEALGSTKCVLEQRVSLAQEISVLVARRADGETVVWPVAENEHRGGILDISIVPARIAPALAEEARTIGMGVARELGYVGVLCVEMFVTTEGRLLINEMAPRPHNSGHYSIDACLTSQFEQQCRVLVGAPLGEVRQHTPAVMVNLLGDAWFLDATAKEPRQPDWHGILADPRAKLHLYGKKEARRGRKMGHITCLGETPGEALEAALSLREKLGPR